MRISAGEWEREGGDERSHWGHVVDVGFEGRVGSIMMPRFHTKGVGVTLWPLVRRKKVVRQIVMMETVTESSPVQAPSPSVHTGVLFCLCSLIRMMWQHMFKMWQAQRDLWRVQAAEIIPGQKLCIKRLQNVEDKKTDVWAEPEEILLVGLTTGCPKGQSDSD